MHDVRGSIMRITDALRNSFNDVLITGSYLINKVFSIKTSPESTINEAEALSGMFRDVAVLIDDIGFLNSLGSLGVAKVRGSLTVFVYDIHDVRPFCNLMNLPCLEPWDQESLSKAIKESRDYSEAFELPYVVRLGPWLSIGESVSGIGVRHREPTFNKNWGETMRWGLNRLLDGVRRDMPEEVRVRSRDNITIINKGDGVLVSGSAWPFIKDHIDRVSNYSIVLSLYVNPLPKNSINAKYVVDPGDYLVRELSVNKLMSEDIDKWYNDLINNIIRQFFFREPGDPLMIIEWLFSKYRRQGEVPIIAIDPAYAHLIDIEGLTPSYDMLPTFFEPRSFDQIIDIVINPLMAVLAFLKSGYNYGRLIAVANPCTLMNQEKIIREIIDIKNEYLIIIPLIKDECKDAINVLSQIGVNYKVINYDPSTPLASLSGLLSIINSRGIVIVNIITNSMGKYMFKIDDEYCDNCGDCLRIKCPAIQLSRKPIIDTKICIGCGICQLVCSRGAIVKTP
ncbi:MAG: ATP-binding protein [Vulcanisaeta sp.]|uniref:ATP-binding protein n=1 Tax=Vulcanisaeta sp. TaxID=2020871 RepID=UPI003D136E52